MSVPSTIPELDRVWTIYKTGRLAKAAAIQQMMALAKITEVGAAEMLDSPRSVAQRWYDAMCDPRDWHPKETS